MSYFDEIYKKRVNRYGTDYKSRLQGMRERDFSSLLDSSVYRVDWEYDDVYFPALLEPDSQDETQTLNSLLTKRDVDIPNGAIFENNGIKWMVYWKEYVSAKGYNKYTMIKMSHTVTWIAQNKKEYTTPAYFYGQEDNMLKDELKSRSRSSVLYTENLKCYFFICPLINTIKKDDYVILSKGTAYEEDFRVTGYDKQSTLGIEFVTVDPIYILDKTPAPEKTTTDSNEDFFWLNGGDSN